ncbi:MAG: DUF1489 family protein [Alphaproteobacteria bacterium]|nr:DUF1489 family protein [Alphaproteobacteria bacterium]
MIVNLLKMCVGINEIDELARWQRERLRRMKAAGQKPKLRHVTRHTPKRRDEILAGGSLYWIIRGFVRVRQRIFAIETVENDKGEKKCGLVLDRKLVRTELQPRRPHQGWRYLEVEDAPRDLPKGVKADDIPPALAAELKDLGLL